MTSLFEASFAQSFRRLFEAMIVLAGTEIESSRPPA